MKADGKGKVDKCGAYQKNGGGEGGALMDGLSQGPQASVTGPALE